MSSSRKSVSATFDRTPELRVRRSSSSGGTVTSSPSGIDCGSRCSERFSPGTKVILTAVPKTGYYFDRWSGCSSSDEDRCTVQMTSINKSVTAYFDRLPELRVRKSPSSGGTVASSPSGINCGSRCEEEFTPGTEVTLTAVPSSGYYFERWSGCSSSDEDRCTVKMLSTNKSVTATFDRLPELRVRKSPSSGGTVTSSPSGINCGSRCEEEFVPGTRVTLSADPSSGYSFDRWSGCSSTVGDRCTVSILSSDKSVTAYFERDSRFRLSATGVLSYYLRSRP